MDENTYYVYMDGLDAVVCNLEEGQDKRIAIIKLVSIFKKYLTDEYYDDVS